MLQKHWHNLWTRPYQSIPKPNIQKIYSSLEVRDMNSIELNRFDIYLFEISSRCKLLLATVEWNSSDKRAFLPAPVVRVKLQNKKMYKIVQFKNQ